jgi:phage/conjugal plasmid C-4 type zinc finger TraR family protein
MSDEADLAQGHEEFRRQLALRAARADMPRLATPRAFGLCDDCGDPIEAERRQAVPGASRCLVCQERVEKRARLFA